MDEDPISGAVTVAIVVGFFWTLASRSLEDGALAGLIAGGIAFALWAMSVNDRNRPR